MGLSVDATSIFARRARVFMASVLVLAATALPVDAASRRSSLGENRWVALDDRAGIWIEALPRRGEGLLAFSRRLTGSERHAAELARVNGRKGLLAGVRTKVPFELVQHELQLKALRSLFPNDRPEAGVWTHKVVGLGPGKSESLPQIALWFTGRADHHGSLREANRLGGGALRAGQVLKIPAELLRPALRRVVPAAAKTPPKPALPQVVTVEPADRDPASAAGVPSLSASVAQVITAPPVAAPTGAPPPSVAPTAVVAVSETANRIAPPDAVPAEAPTTAFATASVASNPVAAEPLPQSAVRRDQVAALPPEAPRGLELAIKPSQTVISAAPTPWRLSYGRDERGDFALYRLQPGEALYSSVVVRFTGRIHAEDVNALAVEVARRSGIIDVTDIPIGFAVKIPFDVLQPEFLPRDHPRRREYETTLAVTEQLADPPTAVGLEGVTVILDAGHGGRDSGASFGGVWESVYVYDIVMRIRRILELETAASVVTTTADQAGFEVPARDVLAFSRGHKVLTTPPYAIEDAVTGVHLRWYLINSVFRRAVKEHADPKKVVFISVHADSLHPSIRGAMAYIPGTDGRVGSFGKSGAVFAARREFNEQPTVRFEKRELLASEGLSRDLANHLINALRRDGLAVHPFKPVRETVIRNRRQWVPAVLRYNKVPAALLFEVCNLANDQDRRLIQTAEFRQQMAESMVAGLMSYYGYVVDPRRPQLEAAARR